MEGREGRDGNAEWDEPCACAVWRGVGGMAVVGAERRERCMRMSTWEVGRWRNVESSISGPRVIVVLSVAAIKFSIVKFPFDQAVLSDLTSHNSHVSCHVTSDVRRPERRCARAAVPLPVRAPSCRSTLDLD